jgi:AbrB family looped-hinge helix DNA binding protein
MYVYDGKVTRKFQITLPKKVRKALDIRIGDGIKVTLEGSQVIIEKEHPILDDITGNWDLPLDGKKYVEQYRGLRKRSADE